MSMKTILQGVALAVVLLGVAGLPRWAAAAGSGPCGDVRCLDPKVDLDNRASLQRGAQLFVNYCVSCHSAAYMRYNRVGKDLGLTDEQVEDNLMFTTEKAVSYTHLTLPTR